ncbi:hypothetical protein [Pseudomonas moorei]|uniref:hypothetical protein n=1 Tax=Pseudomonas moorei TaxID=395599 RepID=UPI0036F2F265
MRDGLTKQPDTGKTSVAQCANRNIIDRLPGNVSSLKIKPPAITEAGVSLLSATLVRMVFEVR